MLLFLCKHSISISACYSFINSDVLMNRRSGVKMFLSIITAPIVLAHLINFLTKWCYVNPPQCSKNLSCKFDPPRLFKIWICPRQYIKKVKPWENWLQFTYFSTHCLYKAMQPETEIISFTEKRHVQIANNPRSPQCQTEPELLCSSPPP